MDLAMELLPFRAHKKSGCIGQTDALKARWSGLISNGKLELKGDFQRQWEVMMVEG